MQYYAQRLRVINSYICCLADLDYTSRTANRITFQSAKDSVVCTSFEIIDDSIALEEEETFVVDFRSEEGEFAIGDNIQTTVTIQDNDGRWL